MGSIRVIGLGGRAPSDDWAALLDGRDVCVRHEASARRSTPAACAFVRVFDDVLDSPNVAAIASTIAAEITARAVSADVAYLVPGIATAGDATVEALAKRTDIEVMPGVLELRSAPGQPLWIMDALELAIAELAWPFDTGLPTVNGSVRTFIPNWYGAEVTRLAGNRIARTYAELELYVHGDSLLLEPITAAKSVDRFLQTVAQLRRPDGCPWDREQTHASMLEDLREEVDEVAAAVGNEDWVNLAEELGDVLLHVAMQSQIAAEAGRFTFDEVVGGVTAKLIRRHPHVFGDVVARDAAEVLAIWKSVKSDEKRARDGGQR